MTDSKSIRLLLVDRDRPLKMLLERDLPDHGPLVVALRSGNEAQDLLTQEHFDVSQLDFEVPGVGRIETRRRHRTGGEGSELLLIDTMDLDDEPPPISLQSIGDELPDDQFLTKPLLSSEMKAIANEAKAQLARNRRLRADTGKGPILGDSSAMCEVLDIVERVAAGSASVLIRGETGTGKTMVARRVHDLSPRADQRFVAINCSAFQDQLLESELFGHEKGAFTGALSVKQGLFEAANGGTLFLDEVGDMSSAMQAKLLQVLDDGELRRVGGTGLHKVDVRVIAATNKDLQQAVKKGEFREDLLFRLNVIHLRMPSLRERQQDIPTLVEHFLDRFRIPGRPRKVVSPEAIQLMTSYAWPGNVRELANTVEGLMLLAPGVEIRAEDLPPSLRPRSDFELDTSETPLPLKEVERLHIIRTLRYTEGKKAPAARLLKIDIKTLNSKIKNYSIET
ncbi:MAG: sigma-54 dependent transcriptional regulator [Acidobacteriota bacterium]